MLFYLFLFFSFLTHCSFAFSSKYDNETIHSDHIFCAQNTDNSYNHFLCTEHRDNSYNHFLCGEQYRHWVKSLNVLCVEHSIIILWVKRGFLWKCAQVLFGITEYLYYYFMSAEHRRLILTIICVCVWKNLIVTIILCVKNIKTTCDHHFCVTNTKNYDQILYVKNTIVTIIFFFFFYVQNTDISEHQLMRAEHKYSSLLFSVRRTQWLMTAIFSVQNTDNSHRHVVCAEHR